MLLIIILYFLKIDMTLDKNNIHFLNLRPYYKSKQKNLIGSKMIPI